MEDLERWGLLQEGSSLSQTCAEPRLFPSLAPVLQFLQEPQKITEIIRYGQGTMPGAAAGLRMFRMPAVCIH